MPRHALPALLAALPALAAQSPISPQPRATTEGNTSSSIPFGDATVRRYQELHSNLPQSPLSIRGLSWRQNAGTGTFTGTRTLDVQIAMGRAVRADIVRFNFRSNYQTTPTVVMARRTVNFGAQGAASNPGPSAFQGMSLTFDAPFAWNGTGSLAWEAAVFSSSASGLFADADAEQSPRNFATDVASGTGCIAAGGTDPMRLDITALAIGSGTFYAPFVRAATPNAPLTLALGITNPNAPLPGLCGNVRTDLAVMLPLGATDSRGAFEPIGSLVTFVQRDLGGATLHAQTFTLDVGSPHAIPILLSNGVATTFPSLPPSLPDVSRIYADGDATSPLAPFRGDTVGVGLVTRFDT
jgi:hypothetical protein